VGIANHLFGQRTPAEAEAAEAKKRIEAGEVVEKKCGDRVAGERLMRDRRHARRDTAAAKIQEQHDLEREARARHDVSDSDEPFDPAPFRADCAKWEAELESRTQIANKQDEVFAAAETALSEAKRAVRRERHEAQLPKVVEALRVLRLECDALAALEGDGVPAVSSELGLASVMTDTVNTERMASGYLNPPARKEIDLSGAVVFLRPTSRISGPMDGRLYNEGDAAGFDHDTASRLVACGAARWLKDTAENAAATERARKRLAAIDHTEGSARESVGWQQAVNE
jgi:hypothetical protein